MQSNLTINCIPVRISSNCKIAPVRPDQATIDNSNLTHKQGPKQGSHSGNYYHGRDVHTRSGQGISTRGDSAPNNDRTNTHPNRTHPIYSNGIDTGKSPPSVLSAPEPKWPPMSRVGRCHEAVNVAHISARDAAIAAAGYPSCADRAWCGCCMLRDLPSLALDQGSAARTLRGELREFYLHPGQVYLVQSAMVKENPKLRAGVSAPYYT